MTLFLASHFSFGNDKPNFNTQKSVDFGKIDSVNQYKIVPGPRSKLELGKFNSTDEVKDSYTSTYNFTMKPNNPEPARPVNNFPNSSSIVFETGSNKSNMTSEAMAKYAFSLNLALQISLLTSLRKKLEISRK